jgi:hypothetical protein
MPQKTQKTPKTAKKLIKRINWKLLRRQKQDLLNVINKKATTIKQKESLEGILNLLDSIQDLAVDVLKVDEWEVFKFHDEA